MIVTLGLTIGFGKSDNLAAAYGIAVSATMLMTSVLLFIAMREIWHWPVAAAGAVAALFIVVDGSFFAANMAKVMEGGWVPLLLASIVYGVMWIWHRGATAVQKRVESEVTPLSAFLELLQSGKIARVPGSAVFFTRAKDQTPPVLAWHVRHNRALHENALTLTMTVVSVPRVDENERLTVEREGDHFWRAEVKLGFMEHPDIPDILASCKMKGVGLDLDDVTYYVGAETIVAAEDGKGLAALAGGSVRRDGPQRGAHQRLSSLALRSGGRDRARDRDLGQVARGRDRFGRPAFRRQRPSAWRTRRRASHSDPAR